MSNQVNNNNNDVPKMNGNRDLLVAGSGQQDDLEPESEEEDEDDNGDADDVDEDSFTKDK